MKEEDLPEFLYRGAMEDLSTGFNEGIYPCNYNLRVSNESLSLHVKEWGTNIGTKFVSTSKASYVAEGFALDSNLARKSLFVIKPSGNQYLFPEGSGWNIVEKELSHIGPIPREQIVGGYEVITENGARSLSEFQPNPNYRNFSTF